MDDQIFDKLREGIVNGLVKEGFEMGDGDSNNDEHAMGDADYTLKLSYVDKEHGVRHSLKLSTTTEVTDIEDV